MATIKFPRNLEGRIRKDLDVYPVVAVMGARQVGKSTLCRKIAEELKLKICTLDDSYYRQKATESPGGLLDELGRRAFIDEAQRAPSLFLAIKSVVDRDQQPGAYLLSGSNQPGMSAEIGDSLLGRAAYRTLRPLTLSELRFSEGHPGWSFLFASNESEVLAELEARANISGKLEWRDVVRTGGFPRAAAVPADDRGRLLNDYIEVFANRDIREILGPESPERFQLFFRLVCAWTGHELNASAISRDLGTSVNTIRRWIDALRRSYLIEIVQPYSRSASQRVIKAPKVFVVDPALALAGSRETEPSGFHLETLTCIDLLQWREDGINRELYHWRLAGGQEVDFILQENQQLLPVEIKAMTVVRSRDAKHLRAFRDQHPDTPRGVLLTCDPEIRRLDGGVIAAPWWAVI